jgi:DNA polymerase-3 subunit epsilon
MSYVLVVDTETDGLVKNHLPATDPGQPHLVQLGLVLMTDLGQAVATVELIVKPEGYAIPDAAARVHGITTDVALACGVPLRIACAVYTNLRALADVVVAHNWEFDRTVLAAAIARTGATPAHPGPASWSCTMQLALPVLALPPTERMRAAGFNKHKPPSLTECVKFFFDEDLVDAHSALADARACARVYLELRKRERWGPAEAVKALTEEEP